MDASDDGSQLPSVIVCDRQPVFAKGLAALLASEARCFSRILGVTTSPIEVEALMAETRADVVLLDSVFGVDAINRIRNVDPEARLILLVSDETAADLPEIFAAGACAYCLKQEDVFEICDVIRVVLRGYSVAPSALLVRSLRLGARAQQLSETERRILALLARGATNQDIAHTLHLSERTVRRYLIRTYSKLCVTDRMQAALYAIRWGLVNLDEADQASGGDSDPPQR